MTEDESPAGRGGSRPRPQSVASGEAFRVWLRIGLLSFGGPAGQIALMHRILVEEKRWIGESRFLHALNYCMLLPGPEAQQLATYVGWLLHGTRGGLVAGVLFVLPGAAVILGLSILYAGFHHVTAVEAVFFGIKAAVLAVVVEAVLRIGRRALKNRAMMALAAAAFIAIFFLAVPFPVIVAAAALVGLVGQRFRPEAFAAAGGHASQAAQSEPAGAADAVLDDGSSAHSRPSAARMLKVAASGAALWLIPTALLWLWLGRGNVFTEEALFFSKMAVVTFGGAYAVLAYVAQQAVEVHGWLVPGEMLDGLGLAETTPGPLIMVVQFVGFLGAYRQPGALDPLLAGTLGAPFIEALRGNRALGAALSAITAAVVGVVMNLAVWFALHVVFGQVDEVVVAGIRLFLPVWDSLDPAALLLVAASLIAMLKFKVGMIPTLAGAAALGVGYVYLLA